MGKKQFRTALLVLAMAVLLALLPGAGAEALAEDDGTLAVENYSCGAAAGCSFDAVLSGGSISGQVVAAVYSTAGQLRSVETYSAAETVHITLPGVTPEQQVKVFWLDANDVPRAEAVGFRAETGPAWAVLYSDGELVLQRSSAAAEGRSVVRAFPFDLGGYDEQEDIPWRGFRTQITSASIGEPLAPLSAAYWFYGCGNLKEVRSLERLDTTSATDLAGMFTGCSALTSLDLTGFDTAKVTSMNTIFSGCGSLRTIYASERFVTDSLTTMGSGSMFTGCTSLTGGEGTDFSSSHSGPSWARLDGGTENPGYFTVKTYAVLYDDGEMVFQKGNATQAGRAVTAVYEVSLDGYAYRGWDESQNRFTTTTPWDSLREQIKTVTIMDTFRPRSTACLFYMCNNLSEINSIEKLDTSSVTNLSYMFYKCSGLTSLDLTSFITGKATSMSCMFYDCSGLKTLDVTGFNTENVTSMHAMFYGCRELTTLNVTGFDTENVKHMGYMFGGCSGLTDLDVTSFNTENVTDMSWMFQGCSGLTSLDVSKFDTGKVTEMVCMFYGCSGLTALDVTKFDTRNVTNMGGMFSYCSQLKTLDVTKFDTSKVTKMGSMFYGCSGLTSLDVSKFDTGNIIDFNNMFGRCRGLNTLDISNFDTGNVTDMSYMFDGCSGLTELDLSLLKTENVTNMTGMFSGCSGLTTLDISKFDTENVTSMHAMFWGCRSLPTLDISNFDTRKVMNMGWMFYGCSSLTSLDISSFDTGNVTAMYLMFSGCSKLTTIYVSDNFVTGQETDSHDMFAGCYSLTGGAGTRYSGSHIEAEYARIDGGAAAPGYFTDKSKEPSYENNIAFLMSATPIYTRVDDYSTQQNELAYVYRAIVNGEPVELFFNGASPGGAGSPAGPGFYEITYAGNNTDCPPGYVTELNPLSASDDVYTNVGAGNIGTNREESNYVRTGRLTYVLDNDVVVYLISAAGDDWNVEAVDYRAVLSDVNDIVYVKNDKTYTELAREIYIIKQNDPIMTNFVYETDEAGTSRDLYIGFTGVGKDAGTGYARYRTGLSSNDLIKERLNQAAYGTFDRVLYDYSEDSANPSETVLQAGVNTTYKPSKDEVLDYSEAPAEIVLNAEYNADGQLVRKTVLKPSSSDSVKWRYTVNSDELFIDGVKAPAEVLERMVEGIEGIHVSEGDDTHYQRQVSIYNNETGYTWYMSSPLYSYS